VYQKLFSGVSSGLRSVTLLLLACSKTLIDIANPVKSVVRVRVNIMKVGEVLRCGVVHRGVEEMR
jgi:hypothetical protein